MNRPAPLLVLGIAPCVGLCLALTGLGGLAGADPASATQTRTVGAFHGVELAGVLEVEVVLGKPASVEVTGDADLVDKVTTKVQDGVLVLNTPELRNIHRRNMHLRAIVAAPDLDSLALSGTGAMKVTGVANERLAVALPGTGDLRITGTTGALRVTVSGTGNVSAKALSARDAVVDIGGTGDARLRATRSLDARISGTGSISVDGSPPQVKKSVSGLGSIHVR